MVPEPPHSIWKHWDPQPLQAGWCWGLETPRCSPQMSLPSSCAIQLPGLSINGVKAPPPPIQVSAFPRAGSSVPRALVEFCQQYCYR